MPELPSPNGVVGDVKAPKTADDVLDSFKDLDLDDKGSLIEDDAKKESKTEKEDEEEVKDIKDIDEEEIELKDADDVEEDEKPAEEDELKIDGPPRKKEILAKYPNVFKDFPFLEKAMYRDKQYSELFGSYDDAKEIADKAEVFASFENQLLSGNTEEILKNVKETDSKAFDQIVDNYLHTLVKVDKDAYFEVVGNINKRLIRELVKEANDTGNDDMKQAALIVNQFLFNSSKMQEYTRRTDGKESDAKSEVEKERLSFLQERFETSRDEMQVKIDNTLKATISEYIDPKGNMSPYVKKNAITDALRILTNSIGNDPSVRRNLDKMWQTAFSAKFSRESLGKIQSFYLSRAKPGIKTAILKARAEALKGVTPSAKAEKEDENSETEEKGTSQRRNIVPGRTSQPKGKNEMKKGETVTDFFMRD